MMRKFIAISLLAVSTGLQAQALRDINFRYRYNPNEAFTLSWDIIREQDAYTAFYSLGINDTSRNLTDFKIQWEIRKSLNDKSGTPVNILATENNVNQGRKTGFIRFSEESDQAILVAKVMLEEGKKTQAFLFYKKLPHALSLFARTQNGLVTNQFITRNQPVSFHGFNSDSPLQVSFYKDAFPAAAPAFSTAQARVAKTIKPDSIFYVNPRTEINFMQKGLYLVQHDTASAQGVALRVEDDYPKLRKLESLQGPLVYICTRQEYDKITAAGSDKKKFDQVILGITGNTERARTFMRNYFNRVESANEYFSSYKEGWKTDRGMIYIIYGIPDVVYLFDDREVWEYKNESLKERFQFVKSATIFDPENYVLVRSKSFSTDWYAMIDLWRKARF